MFYSLGIYFDSNWELPNTPSIGTLQIVHLNEYKIEENCWNFIYKLSSAPPYPLVYRLPRQNNLFTCLQRWNTGGEKKRNKWTFRKAKSSFKEISNLIGQVLFELLWGIWTELCWVKCYKGIRITMNTDGEVLILELLYKISFTNRNELSIFFHFFFRFRSSELGTFSQKVFFSVYLSDTITLC